MTRYAIDAPTAIRLVREGRSVPGGHRLVAPKALQSRALSIVYGQVRRGELEAREAVAILDGITTMKIRLLGDFAIIHARTSYTRPGGSPGRGWYTDDWQLTPEGWRCVSAHVSRS